MRQFFFGSMLRTLFTVFFSIFAFVVILNACSPQPQYQVPAPVAVAPQAPVVVGQPPVVVAQPPVVVHQDGFWSGYMMGHILSRPYYGYGPTIIHRTVVTPAVIPARPVYVPRAVVPSYTPRPYSSYSSRSYSSTRMSVGRRR